MPRTGIEPVTRGFSILCSTDWAIWAYTIFCVSCGGRIWTYDLRVMSPTSFQTAPPRDIMLYMICSLLRKYSRKRKWMEVDSNHRSNLQQIYSLSPLATRESIHMELCSIKPMIGLEPITCWLQISCSANWATSAYTQQPICNQLLCLQLTRFTPQLSWIEPHRRTT